MEMGPLGVTNRENTEELVRWEAPPGGWVVLNIDGATKGNPGLAGGGGGGGAARRQRRINGGLHRTYGLLLGSQSEDSCDAMRIQDC